MTAVATPDELAGHSELPATPWRRGRSAFGLELDQPYGCRRSADDPDANRELIQICR